MSAKKEEREQKFIAVYRSYVDEIYQYIYLRIGLSKALAEDLTQEIFVDVFKGLAGFKGLCSERTWVYKIAKNKLNDFYRKQYAQKFELTELEGEAELLDDTSQNVEERTIESYECKKVRSCLDGLPEQYKIILVLKYIDDKSVKEIALIVGKSSKAVESVLHRAKTAFRRSYTQCDEKEGL